MTNNLIHILKIVFRFQAQTNEKLKRPDRQWDPPSQLTQVVLLTEIKRPRREADNSSATSADMKDEWSYTSTSPYTFVGPQGQL